MPHLFKILENFPLKTFVVAVFLSFISLKYPPLSVKLDYAEFYPFSSFPMYSSFASQTNLVFITDAQDQPLATYRTFGIVSSALKKSYASRLSKLKTELGIPTYDMTPEQKRPAGEACLAELKESVAPAAFANGALPHVKLYEIIISRNEDGEITRTRQLIAELKES